MVSRGLVGGVGRVGSGYRLKNIVEDWRPKFMELSPNKTIRLVRIYEEFFQRHFELLFTKYFDLFWNFIPHKSCSNGRFFVRLN